MENYSPFSEAQLRAEIEKCEFCSEKPCLEACPAHCSPADFILAARLGAPSDYGRSAEKILMSNPLGHVCGIVCPDTFCMDACAHKNFDCAVNIPKIQATVLQRARELKELRTPDKPALNGKRIAIIGAGPAGLAATAYLAPEGYQVHLYDEAECAGGACWLIPEARLPRKALRDDVEFVLSLGKVETHFGQKAPEPEVLLGQGYDAVLVAMGQPDCMALGIPGEEHAVSSLQFLKNPKAYQHARRVAVIGGGAVAADCAVTARENGAEAVELFVRRRLSDMPLTGFERKMLFDSEIDITTRTRVQGILTAKGTNGSNSGASLTLQTTKVAPEDGASAGSRKLRDIPGTSVERPGFDLVVMAIGSAWNGQKRDDESIFYAGDCVEGASTVVQAVASGKNAARALDLFVRKATAEAHEEFAKQKTPGSRSRIKSRVRLESLFRLPVDLKTDFFGIQIRSPFLLSAAPATDGFDQMKRAYEAGWCGGVMKTSFDNVPIHIPAGYMTTFGGTRTHGNCDNVSGHPLDRVCREIAKLRELYPDHLTMASTGGPVTGRDEHDAKVWQSNTRKLENAGACGVEYSLSCPQGGDGTEGDIVSQNAELTAKVIDWILQVSDPDIPKLFKLTGAVTSIKPILAAIREVLARYPGKKAGVTLANSFPVMGFRPYQRNSNGHWDEGVVYGMSGEGVVPISYLTLANAGPFGIEISGNGGVMDYRAAANFLALGAGTVQVCTVTTKYGIHVIEELESGLSHLLAARGLHSVKELRGIALPEPVRGFTDLTPIKGISAVRPELCQSCGNCTHCPYLAIRLDQNRHPMTDPSRCVGCSICVQQCFAGALFMRERTPDELSALKE